MPPESVQHDLETSDLLTSWPANAPLALLASHGDGEFGRFSLAGSPSRMVELSGPSTIQELDQLLTTPAHAASAPTGRGWIIALGYELGARIEPAVTGYGSPESGPFWPEATLLRCDGVLFRPSGGTWSILGDPGAVPELAPPRDLECHAGTLRRTCSRQAYEENVAKAVEYIHAGDCFQVNLAQRMQCDFSGSVRCLAQTAFEISQPRYGAHLETGPGRAIVSMSPELFLEVNGADSQRTIRTRPIKGTLQSDANPDELLRSEKDAAELAMIVDLMRNDLGRICTPGSIAVNNPRTIETHKTIHHTTGDVSGTLQRDTSFGDLLRATFPPGSVTGAPKIRAMQIIETLEPIRRGPYCGAIGWLDDSGIYTASKSFD